MHKIFLVRHGEVDNPQNLIYGRLPGFGLTQNGKQQVEQSARHLLSEVGPGLEIIFSSPLLRTRQTAAILQKTFPLAKIVLEKEIIEIDVGWEGKKKVDLIKSGIWDQYLQAPDSITSGEGILGAQKRVVSWLENTIIQTKYDPLVIVSHQDIIRSLTLFLEDRPISDLNSVPCETASITRLVINNALQLQEGIAYWEPNDF